MSVGQNKNSHKSSRVTRQKLAASASHTNERAGETKSGKVVCFFFFVFFFPQPTMGGGKKNIASKGDGTKIQMKISR